MTEEEFQAIKDAIDADLDGIKPPDAEVGIKLGWNLYTEFRQRGLLRPKLADMILRKWMLPSYRDKFIADSFDIPDDEYRIGTPNA